ncbi:MAG: DUF3667 domain-containing protein [Kangiellaceae bacterium]|nr:DUF3667 domain-containing protein [Kangiellaceae bacterium]
MNSCINCKSEINGSYCFNCGRPFKLARIDGQLVLQEISSVLNFEKGIFFTIKELFLRPKQNMKSFILEDRGRLVKPVIFLIVTSLIFTLTSHFFQIENGYVDYTSDEHTATTLIFDWIQSNYGYSNIIMGMLFAVWIRILFRKYDYNFFEILIILCFVMGIEMLIFSVFGALEGVTKLKLMQLSGLFALGYYLWVIGNFFESGKIINYFKALLTYVLGMLSFALLALFTGYIIELV